MEEDKIIEETNNDRCYVVYMHTSPSGKRYIGITRQNPPSRRWRKDGGGYNRNFHFWNAICKYGWNNFEHEILYENLTKEEANNKEVELISLYKSDNPNFGYNNDHGGNNVGKITEKQKMVLKELFSVPVRQYSKYGEFIKEYSSMTEAEKITGLSASSISKCCRNEAKLCGDCIWRFKDEVIDKQLIDWCNSREPSSRRISVSQYDRYGCLIKSYASTIIAEEETRIDNSSIIKCCKNEQRIAGGYIWRYSDESLTKEHLEWCISGLLKRVVQYFRDGSFVKIYKNAAEAEFYTGICSTGILECCKNTKKSAGNYLWRYEGEELTKEYVQWCNTRKTQFYRGFSGKSVIQYTMDGAFIAIYKSTVEAEQITGVKCSNISLCCNGHRSHAKGFIWRYASDIRDPYEPLFPTASSTLSETA